MPSYVYMTNGVGADLGLTVSFQGPDDTFKDHFHLVQKTLPVNASSLHVLTVDRTTPFLGGEKATMAELQIHLGPTFVAAVQILITSVDWPINSFDWGWRGAEMATGVIVDDNQPHTGSVTVGEETLQIRVQGVDEVGFDDLNVSIIGTPLQAKLVDTTSSALTVDQFAGSQRSTPGNVGVCLSGGGSRAMTAGVGQLLGLSELGLLSKVKAISTVSGGSWVGVTWSYLTSTTTDAELFGAYVPPASLTSSGIAMLPDKSLGKQINTNFSPGRLALQAVLLRIAGTPLDMIWQTLVGIHILKPYGLFETVKTNGLPNSLFSADQNTLNNDVTNPNLNPSLKDVPAHLQADNRPYLICNTAMFVRSNGISALAPVQATPYFTGIVSTPGGTDANDKVVGGGGVTSFAFSSELESVSGPNVSVLQPEQWSLADIVGSSSAFFAGYLGSAVRDPATIAAYAAEHGPEALEPLADHLDPSKLTAARDLIERADPDEIAQAVALIRPSDFVPRYTYWPVLNAAAEPAAKPTMFADGGNLENTGIASMLTYQDVSSIIAFVNSQTPLAAGTKGIIENGSEVQGTRIVIDEQVPPLFGFQPYKSEVGYLPYAGPGKDYKSRSQVFKTTDFAPMLKGLWAARGQGGAAPARFVQQLEVQANDWFGVKARPTVTVLWSYLNPVDAWRSKLVDEVESQVPSPFPSYSVFTTGLTAQQINLMTSLTAWCVCDPTNADPYKALFAPDRRPRTPTRAA